MEFYIIYIVYVCDLYAFNLTIYVSICNFIMLILHHVRTCIVYNAQY